ncbi:MAG TPA: hypothetical protein VHG27_09690, partial [Xanthobacteraceae bacterium]|nr:hypothetical protein [Xanthobacteraceae bacterium]
MARNARDIRFATFNLRNLHLPGKPIYSDRNGWSQAEYDAKLQWSASILKQLDADVIGFQELWDGRALDELFERAELQDSYDRVTREQGSGISVALAARRGLLRKNTVEWIADFPETCRFAGLQEARDAKETVSISIDKFSRPLLKAVIQP